MTCSGEVGLVAGADVEVRDGGVGLFFRHTVGSGVWVERGGVLGVLREGVGNGVVGAAGGVFDGVHVGLLFGKARILISCLVTVMMKEGCW